MARSIKSGSRVRGFTLLELLFVMVIVTLLAAIVGPSLTSGIDKAREATLKDDLTTMRKAIDNYYTDNGKYPPTLEKLVEKKYLRNIPADPITQKKDTWVLVHNNTSDHDGGIVDVKSGSDLIANDGTRYQEW